MAIKRDILLKIVYINIIQDLYYKLAKFQI